MAGTEDKAQDITLAVLKNDVDYIKKEVGSIGGKLDILEKNYIRRSEVDGLKKDADSQHKELNESIRIVELDLAVFKTQVKTWGAAAVMALGILQFVISAFIK